MCCSCDPDSDSVAVTWGSTEALITPFALSLSKGELVEGLLQQPVDIPAGFNAVRQAPFDKLRANEPGKSDLP